MEAIHLQSIVSNIVRLSLDETRDFEILKCSSNEKEKHNTCTLPVSNLSQFLPVNKL
jgi:hypothetical protein